MLKVLMSRIKQGYRTAAFPDKNFKLPERGLGRPIINNEKCAQGCRKCVESCPVQCIVRNKNGIALDLGLCVFCGNCVKTCPAKVIRFTCEYSMSSGKKEHLIIESDIFKHSESLNKQIKRLFGRSMKLRQVSAGGCNACEADTNVLNTLTWDIGRFGIQFVASPRHADGLLITGPVTQNMALAVEKTYKAVASPKIVIAVGACAISGGIYRNNPAAGTGADSIVPVDLYIPGCPPHPATILDGLLRLLEKI